MEPQWLTEERQRSRKIFEDTPLPTTKNEEWKYTDLSTLPLEEFIHSHPDTVAALSAQRSQENGWNRKGVIFEDLLEAAEKYPDIIRRNLHSLIPPSQGKLSALHAARLNGGSYLFVPEGTTIPVPLRSAYSTENPSHHLFPHTLIVLERGSSATYIDEYQGRPGLSVAHVEIVIQEGAHLTYFNVQHYAPDVPHFLTQTARLGPGAQLTTASIALGGSLVRSDVRTFLAGEGSRSEILGVVLGDKGQKFDIQTLQDHSAPNTFSDLLYKAALKDRARSAYSGLIHIGKKAMKSDAYQANRNLLMNRGTRSFSIPKLEIEADDVRCTHGATVGSFDEEQIFYLTSRGVSEEGAREIIVEGFFEPIVNRLPDWGLRERLWGSLRKKIGSDQGEMEAA